MPAVPTWFIWALLSAIFTGATALLAKVGLEDVDPDLATLVRTLVVAVFLPLLILITGKWSNPLLLSQRTWLFRALKQGEVSLVVPVDRLSLLVVAVLGFAFLGERPSIFGWLGLLLIGAGGVLFCFAE